MPDEALANGNKSSVSQLHHTQQLALCRKCAEVLSGRLKVEIPDGLVVAEMKKVVAYLDIKEAYIYRDWQAAIGDRMIESVSNASRRFDVIGFGDFEARYLNARVVDTSSDKLWFGRLEGLFNGLDMSKVGVFDARRQQILNLYKAVLDLKNGLENCLEERRQH